MTGLHPASGTMSIAASGATIDPASVPLTGRGCDARDRAITPNPLVISLNSAAADALDPNVNTNVGIATLTNKAGPVVRRSRSAASR